MLRPATAAAASGRLGARMRLVTRHTNKCRVAVAFPPRAPRPLLPIVQPTQPSATALSQARLQFGTALGSPHLSSACHLPRFFAQPLEFLDTYISLHINMHASTGGGRPRSHCRHLTSFLLSVFALIRQFTTLFEELHGKTPLSRGE